MTPPFAAPLTRVLCAGLEEVEAKAHLIVVAEKEAFKVRAMAMAAEEEEEEAPPPPAPAPAPAPAPPPAPAPAPRAVTPPRPPRPEERSAAPAAAGSSMFAFYDKNGDGVLDKEEVIGMMAHLGFKTDDSYVAGLMEVFASFDADDSGQIEQAEFGALAALFLRFLRLV